MGESAREEGDGSVPWLGMEWRTEARGVDPGVRAGVGLNPDNYPHSRQGH